MTSPVLLGGGIKAASKARVVAHYHINDKVVAYSRSRNAWMDATIVAIHHDGACDVAYSGSSDVKTIPMALQGTELKRRTGTNGSDYEIYDQVHVYSNIRCAWLRATVKTVHNDGTCDVQCEDSGEIQSIPLALQKITLRRQTEFPPPSRCGCEPNLCTQMQCSVM
eukprot:TRINITY_DN107511_c0_g1_i1.p1 TRINITY_DN107511_c0_g1~~TRINITY_DN107511_c0_g1_i1.p1  ORF type:complete len:166 (-),score=11.59 TRINITY_DN107511_c0_g1_i1:169-666(-)